MNFDRLFRWTVIGTHEQFQSDHLANEHSVKPIERCSCHIIKYSCNFNFQLQKFYVSLSSPNMHILFSIRKRVHSRPTACLQTLTSRNLRRLRPLYDCSFLRHKSSCHAGSFTTKSKCYVAQLIQKLYVCRWDDTYFIFFYFHQENLGHLLIYSQSFQLIQNL